MKIEAKDMMKMLERVAMCSKVYLSHMARWADRSHGLLRISLITVCEIVFTYHS